MDKAVILREAQKYLSKGQIDKAIAELEKLIAETPDGNMYNAIGDLYLRKGNKVSSLGYFHKAAAFFREGGFSLKTLALYKKIINISPTDVDSLIGLGELSEEKGFITDAIRYYIAAGDILSKDRDKDRFLGIYEKILSLAPSNVHLREKVAGLFLKEGLTTHAIKEFLHIAGHRAKSGELEQARDYFMKVLSIHPDNKDAFSGLSSLSMEEGDLPRAVDYLRRAAEVHPDDTELLKRCALLFVQTGAHEEAISYLSRSIRLHPSDTTSHRLMGDIYLSKGERQKAWGSYKTAVELLAKENREKEAVELARQFKDLDPVEVGKTLIELLKRTNDTESVIEEMLSVAEALSGKGSEEAVEYYIEALKLRPDDMQLKKRLAEIEMKMGIAPSIPPEEKTAEDLLTDADIFVKYGLYDDARSILEDLKVRDPGNVNVHTRLRTLYLNTEDREQAVTECLILAELYKRSGETDRREEAIREAFAINPEDPRLGERFGRPAKAAPPPSEEFEGADLDEYAEDVAEAEFYVRQGLSQDALRIYQRLLQIFPGNRELQGKISYLQSGVTEVPIDREDLTIEAGEKILIEEPAETQLLQEQQLDSDVLDIFEEFKKGLEKEIEAEDYETHYNLGIAYKEMGLIDDAIKEFQTSRNDTKYFVRSMSMLGICYMEKGLYPLAIESFKNALNNIDARDESYWGAKYDLATACERNGNIREAYDLYTEIYGWNSTYRQVNEKLAALNPVILKDASQQKEKKDRVSYL
jgi:tetratricopeptide (TPR) repeat protein